MPEVSQSRAGFILRSLLMGMLAGLLIGVLAGSIMAMRSVSQNIIGFTSDSLVVGVYLALIYGAFFGGVGFLVGLVFAVLTVPGRQVRSGTIFAGTFGIVLAVYVFLSGMRIYNEDLYFYEYSFINHDIMKSVDLGRVGKRLLNEKSNEILTCYKKDAAT